MQIEQAKNVKLITEIPLTNYNKPEKTNNMQAKQSSENIFSTLRS